MKIGCFMEDDTGKQIDLMICDNFKSRYESTIHPNILKNTSQYFSTKQLNLLEKNKCVNNNHKIYLLYGNIAYSMGSFHKAQKFYQTGINTIIDENKDSPNLFNYVIFKSLLQNNLAKCLINSLNIQQAIPILESALIPLNHKLSQYESEKNNNIINLDNNNNGNAGQNGNVNVLNKHSLSKLKLLKLIIEFNLAEVYYVKEDYKQSHIVLDRIFEDLTSESTAGYYESHNFAEFSYDDKEINKFFVKYYYICGKINFRLDNLQLAMESFSHSINLRGDDKNENKEDLAQIYNYISLIFCKQKQFEKALKYITKSLNIYWLLYGEEHTKTYMIQLNLSYIQKMKGENLKCLETLNKIRESFIKTNDEEKVFGAVIYRAIGTCFFEMENEIKGLSFYTKANNIYKKYFISNKITMSEINSIILNLFGLINI
jgi:tetratricopeptide (TPR) repeat protein